MTDNLYFETAASWTAARTLLEFEPREPKNTEGRSLRALRVHVRDHKKRELSVVERSLEAHYGEFVITQARNGVREAERWARIVSYGPEPHDAQIAGCPGRVSELGPEPPPDDIDGRRPAVVTWHDGDMFYLVASDTMSSTELLRIASSLYV